MNTVTIAIAMVAVLHMVFLVLEMFFWTRPLGRRVFGLGKERAQLTAALAANQGLYNGFLAAGLIWSLCAGEFAFQLQVFFLGCVIAAGVFGAWTVGRVILWVQALPGAVALLLVLLCRIEFPGLSFEGTQAANTLLFPCLN